MSNIRNLAIIAHVDHGKTTLIDNMLKQSGTFRENQQVADRLMDSNELERERGITIVAKCTSITYGDYKLNIIDTPGHADFGGEVERVLSMVDGALLLVDSSEGPMPQTKFVLNKALQLGLCPIVIINKVDRSDSRVEEVINEVFDLFVALGANERQLDFPILYAVGRDGWATPKLEEKGVDLGPLFEIIIKHVPSPSVHDIKGFSMLATILNYDSYVGRILIGKVYSGEAQVNDGVKAINLRGELVETSKLTKLFGFKGIDRTPIDVIRAGDIIAIAGLGKASVSDTICSADISTPIASTPIDPPTMAITIGVNDSPLAGQEGSKVTSRMILERLQREAEVNVAIALSAAGGKGESFEVGGRGELQLGILIESMRREGFELSVSRPRVLLRKDDSGNVLEPIEEVIIDVDEEYNSVIVEKLLRRKGDLMEIKPSSGNKLRLVFHIPSRGLIGYQAEFRNDTRGTGVLSKIFLRYEPYKGDIEKRGNGVLISNCAGETTAYALWNLKERGMMFVAPKTKVYEGMVVGEHNRSNDLDVNAVRGKKLTNMRASGSDENILLTPHKELTLEEAISYIEDDELIEVTPKSIRLRKRYLSPNDRKKNS
ncbi:translational GTPase TypA [Rickettsiales endosymbiont of Peranema trichophorum]|uniref:translational GTPase TypA n=1 Tax=Rickettsiales endosymbiont of Peranema trichophorum TaxID=2486577 RepID=UPI001022EA1E|nr:translational GTPase TypA [Rickettsiales endosymbiont of Peranema trichophorum]RZI47427.1 translational GTPase TypA [Rickettsiales endosymbiont of Peranema trichophorum]